MKILDAQWRQRYWILKHAEFLVVVVVFTVVYVVTTEFPSGALPTLKWLAFLLVGAIEWLIYFGVFLSIKYNFSRWRQTIRLVGFPSPDTRRTMRRLAKLRKDKRGLGWIPFLLLAVIFGASFYATHVGLFRALCVALVASHIMERFRKIVPPIAIFLTTSADDNLALYARISYAVRRLRVVALLRLQDSHTDLVSVFTRADCFRTESDEDWERVVQTFIEMAPMIVLDARQVTPAVISELHRVVYRKRGGRREGATPPGVALQGRAGIARQQGRHQPGNHHG